MDKLEGRLKHIESTMYKVIDTVAQLKPCRCSFPNACIKQEPDKETVHIPRIRFESLVRREMELAILKQEPPKVSDYDRLIKLLSRIEAGSSIFDNEACIIKDIIKHHKDYLSYQYKGGE